VVVPQLDSAVSKFNRWSSLSRGSADRQKLGSEVEDECKSIMWQVDEMEKAVDVAEQNLGRFQISQAEVATRRKWILQTKREASAMRPHPRGSMLVTCSSHD
jgi:syntaxin of plants SYP6